MVFHWRLQEYFEILYPGCQHDGILYAWHAQWVMTDKPSIQKIVDQLDQLLIKILLSALKRLMDDITTNTSEDKIKF